MIKNLFLVAVCMLFATTAFAGGNKTGWELNLQQLSLNLTSTEVHENLISLQTILLQNYFGLTD